MRTDEEGLLRRFLEAVEQSELSPEAISERVGGNPSGPTIRRYQRGDLPKRRLDPATRQGMEVFVTGRNQSAHVARGAGEEYGRSDDFWGRIDAIESSDLSDVQKVYKIDALAAAIRARAQERDAAAAEGRAQAMLLEVEASRERAAAIERGEELVPVPRPEDERKTA